ncbi:protoporphyrinogen oxidase [Bacillus smithii]|uniref:protoporphyrinogen oxidase n=1 Tax=Bacillus smithii TaxID=1479 RepID=UPI0030C8E37E
MVSESKKVAVIGGGITGLTAAYYLQKAAQEKKLPLEVTLIEASPRLGGKIQTIRKDGFVIERGPDSYLARKKSATRLAENVGIADQLVSNATGQSYVLVNERLYPIPGGSVMGIPTQVFPFVVTGLFSFSGKLRAAFDFLLPRSKPQKDQALGPFLRRRFGDEVVENLVEPLLSGIYAGDIDQMSLMATFPQFYTIEQKYRSLILGMKKMTPNSTQKPAGGQKKGGFLTFRHGLETLVEAIESQLIKSSVLKGTRVVKIEKEEDQYRLLLHNGEALRTDSVVLATPHGVIPDMLPQYDFYSPLKDMKSTSVATIAMAFPSEAIEQDIDGTGFVVSRNSDFTITACTWTHKKWPHTTPKGKVLLRCYVGRAGDETVVDLSDSELEKIVLEDLNKTMNISMKPDFTIVTRWKNAMPQYAVGHIERMEKIKQSTQKELPGLFLAGSSYEGLGVPDCIDQGEEAVEKVLAFLGMNEK